MDKEQHILSSVGIMIGKIDSIRLDFNNLFDEEDILHEKVIEYLRGLNSGDIISLNQYFTLYSNDILSNLSWLPYVKYCSDYITSHRDEKIDQILK